MTNILQAAFVCLIALIVVSVGLGIMPILVGGELHTEFLMIGVYITIPTSIVGYLY